MLDTSSDTLGITEEGRRVGRIIGRRGMEGRMNTLQRGWPDIHATYKTRWPWLP